MTNPHDQSDRIRALEEEVARLRGEVLATKVDPRIACRTHWVDDHGVIRRVSKTLRRLKFKNPSHAALRAFVFRRDGFRCKACGVEGSDVPENHMEYTGRDTISVVGPKHCLLMDHIESGGSPRNHHPDNLQTFCEQCNCRKGSMPNAEFMRRKERRDIREAKYAERVAKYKASLEASHGCR